jgi:hypothetical protein
VNDAALVRGFERLGNLLRDLKGLSDGHRPATQPLRQILALDKLENQESGAVDLLEAVNARDIRVIERREDVPKCGIHRPTRNSSNPKLPPKATGSSISPRPPRSAMQTTRVKTGGVRAICSAAAPQSFAGWGRIVLLQPRTHLRSDKARPYRRFGTQRSFRTWQRDDGPWLAPGRRGRAPTVIRRGAVWSITSASVHARGARAASMANA